MMEKQEFSQNAQAKEVGWEFTFPGYMGSPFTWLLLLLAGIAFFLLFVLVNKVSINSNTSSSAGSHIMPGGGEMQ